MGRTKEVPRGRLAQLQDIIVGSGKILAEQADSLRSGVQRRLVDATRGVEGQVSGVVGALEDVVSTRVDSLLSGLASSFRRDLERIRERIRTVENRLADVPKDGIRELVAPVEALATGAGDRAAAALARGEELSLRVQQLERRVGEMNRATARDALDADEISQRLERIDQRLADLGREVGTKLGELSALRERLTRLEGRVVEGNKDQITRAGEAAGFRDRLARLEARLSDLSKEQLSRAVEAAALRERLFRLEQHAGTAAAPSVGFKEAPHTPAGVED